MPRVDYEVRVVPSLFDRLIDLDPASPRDVATSRTEGVRDFRRAVQRDIEHLLNARNPVADLSTDFAEVSQSVCAYGLPDLSAYNVGKGADQQRLKQAIESTLRAFEPRLAGVVVTLLPAPKAERSLCLRVEAKLLIEPAAESVTFDIVMPFSTCGCEVKDVG